MNLFSRIERKVGRFAIPQLTLMLIVGQVMAYVLTQTPLGEPLGRGDEPLVTRLLLIPQEVLAGEVWRLATFLVVPPITNVLFAFFFWYLFYLMGTSLEANWGNFRYNVYLFVGYIATVAVSFLTPDIGASNGYLQASVFLAFAYLFPNFELCLFFVLPVKIKWLAMLTWIIYFFTMAFGSWNDRLLVLASICNFLLFFGREIMIHMRGGHRRMAWQAARIGAKGPGYFHRCTTCGITDRTHPTMDFRYCDQCMGSCGYCTEHIRNHIHVQSMDTTETTSKNSAS